MGDSEELISLLSMVQWASRIIFTLFDIGALVLVATVIQKHRPDVAKNAMAWAIGNLILSVATPLAYTLAPVIADRVNVSYAAATMLVIGVSSAAHMAVMLLLLYTMVKLAQPPKFPEVSAPSVI